MQAQLNFFPRWWTSHACFTCLRFCLHLREAWLRSEVQRKRNVKKMNNFPIRLPLAFAFASGNFKRVFDSTIERGSNA